MSPTPTDAAPDAGPRLATRVFAAMGLVVLAGAGTMLVVSLLLAPAVFHRHLAQAGVVGDSAVSTHVEEAFAVAALASTLLGVTAALAVAAGGSLLVARRLTEPITQIAETTGRLAGGDFTARVEQPRMGRELAALAESVNTLAQRLQETEHSRSQLLADLAHQLRTPLASVEATVEAIADHVLPADDETLATLTAQSRRLSRLVDDLTTVSRAEERAFAITVGSVDVVALARTATTAAAARFAQAGVTLIATGDTPITALADAHRLGEVLDELLANALHHCAPGDRVTVQVARVGHTVTVSLTDTGGGFDPAQAELIFQRFYRADPARGNPTGTGIGLTVARALVEAQGGTLTGHSDGPGTGAVFTLTLRATPH